MNTLNTMQVNDCQFLIIKELAGTMQKQAFSGDNLTEITAIYEVLYRPYLIKPCQLELPAVEEMNTEVADLCLPHNLRTQAI